MINFVKRQVAVNRYLSTLGNPISVLSHFQVEEGRQNNWASILDAFGSG